jgi:SAM-dependent methyltransferase
MAMPTVHDRNTDQAAYWNGPAGRRWMERQDTQDVLLAPISELSIDRAHPAKGEHVVDIGCGCGGTTIELGRRVGPTGYVLGVDISAPMLGRARERAPAKLPLEFVLADATVHSFEPGRSDLLFSRFGVMFFADPAASFANMRKALRTVAGDGMAGGDSLALIFGSTSTMRPSKFSGRALRITVRPGGTWRNATRSDAKKC